MFSNPLVSVLMITYNQETFISKAVESVLMQETDFPFELVIGEDNSTDKTNEICLKYQQKYPDRILLLERESNLGVGINFIDTLQNCRGKYIALCEGDDYWTDPLKLQKQVDFLEANPDYAICFHRVEVVYESGDRASYISNPNQKETATFEDLAAGNFIHTLSCVFRNGLFDGFPDWFAASPIGDFPLHLLNARHGKIKFLADVMGVYRINAGGVWGNAHYKKTKEKSIGVFENCYRHFYPKGKQQFEQTLASAYQDLAFYKFEDGDYKSFRGYYRKLVKFAGRIEARNFLSLTFRFMLSFFPPVAGWYQDAAKKRRRLEVL